jgi:magnesium chelatase family protein
MAIPRKEEGTIEYPCHFTLVAATNPCPCGYFGGEKCNCKETDVRKYQRKISGPILDRIDLQVELNQLTTAERFSEGSDNESEGLQRRVQRAREKQRERFNGDGIPFNAAIPGGKVHDLCAFSSAGFERFKDITDSNDLTTRSVDRLAKVSRTVADLYDADEVLPEHLDAAKEFVVGGILRDAY